MQWIFMLGMIVYCLFEDVDTLFCEKCTDSCLLEDGIKWWLDISTEHTLYDSSWVDFEKL